MESLRDRENVFFGTLAQLGPCYFFDFDFRMEVLAGLDIEYDSFRDTGGKATSYDAAELKLAALEKMNPFPFEGVFLDSLTTFNEAAMNKAIPLVKAFMPNSKRIGDGKVEIPTMPDYMTQMKYIEKFISRLVALPCHVGVTAHEQTDKDDISGRLFKSIETTGKLAGKLPGYFNEFWRMEVTSRVEKGVESSVFKVRTQPDGMHSARTSYRKALSVLEDPSLPEIYAKINTYLQSSFSDVVAGIATDTLAGLK